MLNLLYSLLSLFYPSAVLVFLVTGPHDSLGALAGTLCLWFMVAADWLSPRVRANQTFRTAKSPFSSANTKRYFDGLLCLIALLQFANIGFMLVYASQLTWQTSTEVIASLVNLVVLRILVGTSSGSSGIIVAHEFIHRSSRFLQLVGRLIMCSVCYEHFIITHKQGHHRLVAQPDDIATARTGEPYEDYCRRVYVEHWQYSWRYEMQRLGICDKPWQLKVLRNRVLQGLIFEILLLISIICFFGWLSAILFLYCAYSGVRLLEAINYFQHWGLGDQESSTIAWVNDSWLTHYALLGMSYHVEHHQQAAKHYQDIAYSAQGPKMPYGYFVMNLWVKVNNRSYQEMANRELERYARTQGL